MTNTKSLFHKIASGLADAEEGKMFGALCIKLKGKGKAFCMYWEESMIFKLKGESHKEALDMKGSRLFDPMGGRPMKEWVQVSQEQSGHWEKFTKEAMNYVESIN
ncbi:MAG: hypothetical protein IIA45_13715 [Bacteroidetes bacterium]|nr:hypothetical protein [Bacteroidota bacterium]